MQQTKDYIRLDEHGVMRVGNTRIPLDSVVAAFQQGHSAETIQQQYPALNLEEVYGTITFILANPEKVSEYLKQQQQVWEQWREKSEQHSSPVLERLRALRETKTHAAS
jgi:uncharacterized protein (DUF433 family)